jgi:hypothetical protein
LGGGIRYAAPLGRPDDEPGRWVPFDRWWDAVVLNDHAGGGFTRKRLVLDLAQKEGGAHVDPTLPADYAALTRENSLGMFGGTVGDGVVLTVGGPGVGPVGVGGGVVNALGTPVPANVRQIAFEVASTISPHLPRLLPPTVEG